MLELQIKRIRLATEALVFPTRFDASKWFERLGIAALAMMILTLGMHALDDRTFAGEPVWLKPLKFAMSFAILFGTLAWAVRYLSDLWRKSWVLVGAAGVSTAAFFFEMAYIAAQAARQEASHFNDTSSFHEMMYGLMGTGATGLMLTVAAVGIAFSVDKSVRLDPRLRLSIAAGFFLTVFLTFWVAGELAGNGGRYIGTPSVDGTKLPLVGWSTEVGDLRPAHFFSLHAMQAIPAFGWLAIHFDLPKRLVWIASTLYASFTILVFFTALQGIPLISL